jgi:hypothetical protein
MGLFLFLLVFVIASQALAFAIALIARVWVWRTEQITLRGIGVERARELVAAQLESVADTRFGFPTGVFRVDAKASTGADLVAREVDFSGSTALDLGRFAMAIPAAFVAEASGEGCAVGLMAFAVAAIATVFLVVPMLMLGLLEIVLRWLMRSRVVAVLEPLQGQVDACSVHFELVGLSAFGLRRALLSGLKAPVLPSRWGGPSAAAVQEPWFQDRLNVVYASGSSIAVIVAITVLAVSSGHHGSSSSLAYQPSSQSPSASQGNEPAANSGASPQEESPSASVEGTEQEGDASESESSGTEDDTGADAERPALSTNADLAQSATNGQDFTIQRPAGNWVLDHLEVQKPGYVETRWHLAGSPNVIFLVDHTPGYAGTAQQGAEGVSAPFKRVSSYHRLGFGPQTLTAGEAWRWEYEVDGKHSVDTFLTDCGTGYAVRGATPASEWEQYSQAFEDAIATLTPNCE